MLDATVRNEGEPDVVQISGGEPTLHPDFFAILDEAKRRPIRHVMVNTNGLRIAQDRAFVERLAGYQPGFEVYLQFDSFRTKALKTLRGADLVNVRRKALAHLNEYNISTTLVCTVCRGVNDDELGEVIRFGLEQPCVRGVTFQPIQAAGRVDGYDATRHRLTVSEIRRRIARQSDVFTEADIVPVPCNPDTLAMGYALKLGAEVHPLTRYVGPDVLLKGEENTIVFERIPGIKERLFDLFSTNHSPESQATCLSDLLCCLPKASVSPMLTYENVFRVLIVQFMDAQSLDIRALKKSCIHIAQSDGRLIPFEAFNLFYRDGLSDRLGEIRRDIGAHTVQRRGQIPVVLLKQ